MLRFFKYLIIILVLALVGILGYAATRPDTFAITRSVSIKAPAEKIFPLINDFTAWSRWSPWEKIDPNLVRKHSGPADGVGAIYEWTGNRDVGSGRMEIRESVPFSRIAIALDFKAPIEASNSAVFTLTPKGETTDVEWTMTGKQPYFGKIVGIFLDIDRMVGGDFDKGLVAMKAEAEKS